METQKSDEVMFGPKYRYSCSESDCEESYRSKSKLKAHSYKHTGQFGFVCDICSRGFQTRQHLRRHQKVHDGYKCTAPDCAVVCETWSALRKHVSVQHRKAKFVCPVCNKPFFENVFLQRHTVVHEKEVTCPIEGCGRKISGWKMEQHLADMHARSANLVESSVAKRFRCTSDQCTASFATNCRLQRHVREVHLCTKNVVKLPCTWPGCTREFSRKYKLDQHMRTHTSERIFACTEQGCMFSYFSRQSLRRHLLVAHGRLMQAVEFGLSISGDLASPESLDHSNGGMQAVNHEPMADYSMNRLCEKT